VHHHHHITTMTRITENLIRKRAEHNDGCLPDLEELSLHQQEIEKIENLERCCRRIRILLLQHNVIGKMEGLTKLKDLEYLNLALNNISKIEGIEGCEALKKLDLTVNFIDLDELENSVFNLRANTQLEDLYLMGNPCLDWAGCRDFIAASLPQVKQLDGELITRQERLLARQKLKGLRKELGQLSDAAAAKKWREKRTRAENPEQDTGWNPDVRLSDARELAAQKDEKEKREMEAKGMAPKEPRVVPGVLNAKGEIRQCNEGKWHFVLDTFSNHECTTLEMQLSKHLDTPNIDVDVHPTYVRVVIKDKVTQLRLDDEVLPDSSKVQRSKTTGALFIKMPLQNPARRMALDKSHLTEEDDLKPLEPNKSNRPRKKTRDDSALADPDSRQVVAGLSGPVSLNIVGEDGRPISKDGMIKEAVPDKPYRSRDDDEGVQKRKADAKKNFVESSSVPPLM